MSCTAIFVFCCLVFVSSRVPVRTNHSDPSLATVDPTSLNLTLAFALCLTFALTVTETRSEPRPRPQP